MYMQYMQCMYMCLCICMCVYVYKYVCVCVCLWFMFFHKSLNLQDNFSNKFIIFKYFFFCFPLLLLSLSLFLLPLTMSPPRLCVFKFQEVMVTLTLFQNSFLFLPLNTVLQAGWPASFQAILLCLQQELWRYTCIWLCIWLPGFWTWVSRLAEIVFSPTEPLCMPQISQL